MVKEFGTDPDKMLDWDKKLGEHSDFVKKAIEPLLTWEMAYKRDMIENSPTQDTGDKDYWIKSFIENPDNVKEYIFENCKVVDLYNNLSGRFLTDDEISNILKLDYGSEILVIEKLKPLGIEGCINRKGIDVFSDEYLEELNKNHENFKLTNWRNAKELPGAENIIGEYLVFDLGKDNHNLDSYFLVEHINDPEPEVKTSILFFRDGEALEDHKCTSNIHIESSLDFNSAKNIVENTAKHFNTLEYYSFEEMKEYLIQQIPKQTQIRDFQVPNSDDRDHYIIRYHNEDSIQEDTVSRPPLTSSSSIVSESDRQLEAAQKTGYVQGVCESVLAFNTDENRKIMSEDTMSFLSKKILSEMNVTKDMAQKFANPDTYKALEKCVFIQKEQKLEQMQSHKL